MVNGRGNKEFPVFGGYQSLCRNNKGIGIGGIGNAGESIIGLGSYGLEYLGVWADCFGEGVWQES